MFTKIKNFLFGSKEAEVVGVPYKVEPPIQEEIKNIDSTVGPIEEVSTAPAVVPVVPVAESVVAPVEKTARKKSPPKKEAGSMSGAAKKKAPAKKSAPTTSATKAKAPATKPKKSKPVVL
jgi:hypothetical protein